MAAAGRTARRLARTRVSGFNEGRQMAAAGPASRFGRPDGGVALQ